MTYQQTLDYLFSQLPMFSRIGVDALKKDLTNTRKLCAFLGEPQQRFRSIHVAGTNGKGSCSHMLAAILQTAGYKTGLYTSPHLRDFRERIRVNGQMIPEATVVQLTEKLQPMISEIEPSFFEITVAMAFEHFAEERVDIAVIEVGLGGRLDSTNVILPELSVITNIGRDHMNILGDTLEKIAFEKAGIIKPGVPVVIGESQSATRDVFIEQARVCQAPISFADERFTVFDWSVEKNLLRAEVTRLNTNDKYIYQLDLAGSYQIKNLVTVLEAVHILNDRGWNLEERVVGKALRQVKKVTGLHGRWETIHENPAVIVDVAHNEDGIRELVQQLETTSYQHLHVVIGMVRDKEADEVLRLLPKTALYYFTRAQIPRALPETELAARAAALDLRGHAYPDVNTAVRAAMARSTREDLILVCGSVFLIGELEQQSLQPQRVS